MASSNSTENASPELRQQNFERGVAFALHLWPALTLAVQNHWGGPDSEDKRDWFAGAVVELFPDWTATQKQRPKQQSQPTTSTTAPSTSSSSGPASADEPEVADVESVLLQVMLDEFEVNVDDDSSFEVADQIVRLRRDCARGNFEEVATLRRRWESRKGSRVADLFKKGEDQDDETDWDTEEDDTDGDEDAAGADEDVAMTDAPTVAPSKAEKPAPEVDGDGFTKVTRRRGR